MVSGRRHDTEEKNKQSSSGVLVIAQLRGIDPEQPELDAGDVTRSVNAISITSVTQLRALLDGFHPGDAIALHVERKGKLMYIAFDLD